MTFVVRRPAGRWEIRESAATANGPRARSLASFRTLTADVMDRAAAAARRPFDREQVRRSARRAGAPCADGSVDASARTLLSELSGGEPPAPGLRRLLLDLLGEHGRPPRLQAGVSVAEWVGASAQRRGETLRDLLELGDRLPAPKDQGLRFPGFSSGPVPAR